MSVVAPPPQDELELLIREARERQRKRWLGAAVALALLAGAAIGVNALVAGSSNASRSGGGPTPAVRSGKACGVRVADTRIVDSAGRTLYREPGHWSPGYPRPHAIRCSGPTVWVVWDNGAGMMQEAYVGARSVDRGRTWRLVFAEPFFGVKAPHELDSYLGPWTLAGSQVAYFAGSCPACSVGKVDGTVSLWVTRNGGQTFHEYKVPALNGYAPTSMQVSGHKVTIRATRYFRGLAPRKRATIRVS